MKQTQKALAIFMSTAMVGGVLAGCGQSASTAAPSSDAAQSTTTQQDPAPAGEKIEITYWDQNASETRTALYNHLIEGFEKENPDIKVNLVPIPAADAKAKYDVAIQSNTAPDCGGVSQYWMSDFIVQDALVPLDDYISNWANAGDMLEMYQQSIRDMAPDGNTYALAFSVTLPTVWVNNQLVADAGAEMPKDWLEVCSLAKTLTDTTKGQYGFSIRGGAGSSQQFEQMMYMHSGEAKMFDEAGNSTANDPAHVELLEQFADLYMNATPESDLTNGYAEMVAAFDSGTAAMIFHNLGSYGEHKKTLGDGNFTAITTLESKQGTQAIVSNGATCNTVFKDSKNPEAAFRWISYLNEHEACSYFNEQIGQIPCNQQALKDSWVEGVSHMKNAADSILSEKCTLITLPINVTGYYDLHNNQLVQGFQQVLLGEISAQDYLDGWAASMTQLKKEYDDYLKSMDK
ncbi:MAG: sugar ABC transporter substrate-binding protein [Gemmiger sp.]|nr:sugar ABC transporter substrate-binding protein [Gemmiger sp.]